MPTNITPDLLKEYFNENKRHKAYVQTNQIMNKLKVHADGEFPEDLIGKRRPNEDDKCYEYRKEIYEAVTESALTRILNYLSLIRKSRDWHLLFNKNNVPPVISARDEETLQFYIEEGFPYFESMTNWMFDVCLKEYLIDPNGVVAVLPTIPVIENGEFQKPFTFIFNSNQVLEFKPDDFGIFLSTDKAEYKDKAETYYDGKIYYVVNGTFVQKWSQINASGDTQLSWEYKHNLNRLPAFKLGGIVHKAMDTTYIYKSRINAIVPFLNEAAREYNDMQIEVVSHVHSDKWVYQSTECPQCTGTGLESQYNCPDGEPCPPKFCEKCNGSRYISTSPFSHMVVTPPGLGQNSIPLPPAGYILKPTEMVKIQDERIEKHFYRAFSTIELQNLSKTPMNESGVSKEVDRDQQNIFVNSVAEGLVRIMDKATDIINDYRYMVIVPDKSKRKDMLPNINVPEKFDLLSSSYLIKELTSARTANVNPLIIRNMEIELAGKQFSSNPELKAELQLVLDLDPLFGLTDDQKMTRLSNKGITQLDYIISCNINQIVKKAIEANKEFPNLPRSKQNEILLQLAEELEESMSSSTAVKKLIPAMGDAA